MVTTLIPEILRDLIIAVIPGLAHLILGLAFLG